LAQLLVSNYAEMRRLNENADKANQQARDSQRRLDQLSEKLEALKNIERTLPGQPK
jgi:transcription elongation GreA/GreB family factor